MDTFVQAVSAALGGALLGASSSVLFAAEGLREGVSGMAARAFFGTPAERRARLSFLLGLAGAGGLGRVISPASFASDSPRALEVMLAAGLLVGFGARLANGCTSGHGILGVARLSVRSVVAVSIFCVAAFVTVALFPLGAGR